MCFQGLGGQRSGAVSITIWHYLLVSAEVGYEFTVAWHLKRQKVTSEIACVTRSLLVSIDK